MNIPAATNLAIVFTAAKTNDAGNYSVIVSNSQGVLVSSNAALVVLPPNPPFFLIEPESQTAYIGQSGLFQARAEGSPPFVFQWRHDGTNLPGTISTSSWGWASLALNNLTPADAGSYSLVVTNDYGSIESSNAVLAVISPIAPAIVRHPRSLEVAEGTRTWLSVTATGSPAPTCIWTKLNAPPPPPPNPGPPPPSPSPTTPNQRLFPNVTPSDAGIYFATATNYGGSVTSHDALLTVLPPIRNLGSWWQGAEDVFVTNGLAFLAQGSTGVAILGVSNPEMPVMFGGVNTPGYAKSVAVVDGLAYVADGSSGLQILNVTNPHAPYVIGTCNPGGYTSELAVRSNWVFLASETAGLIVVNASNPTSPTIVSSNAVHFMPSRITLGGPFAFLSSPSFFFCADTNCWYGGLLVVDISDPAHPFERGRHTTTGLGALSVQRDVVFAAAAYLGVIAYRVTNPAQPTLIGSFPVYAQGTNVFPNAISVRDIHVVNNLAHVVGSSIFSSELNLSIFDVSDLQDSPPVGSYSAGGSGSSVFVEGNRVYATGLDGAVEIIETPFNLAPSTSPTLTFSSPGMQLGVHGRRGRHYDVEISASPSGQPWQVFQTILLTNDTVSYPIAPVGGAQFFRLKQLD